MSNNRNNHLNFSWFIDDKIAGSRGQKEPTDHIYLQQQGIKALVCMSEGLWIKLVVLYTTMESAGPIALWYDVKSVFSPHFSIQKDIVFIFF